MGQGRRTVVAVIFGGRSVEHDVSIVTGCQIMRAFSPARYEVVPVYISRDGRWHCGGPLAKLEYYQDKNIFNRDGVVSCLLSPDARHHGLIIDPLAGRFRKSEVKRIDVIFPAIHGTHGEDGSLQGLIELADIPYVGCGILGSALSNDKILTKRALCQAGISTLDDYVFSRRQWLERPEDVLGGIMEKFDWPLFVKPAALGSSIGIGRADSEALLRSSIDIAVSFDRRVLVEPAVTDGIEINCAVMGYGGQLEASTLEQPLSWDSFLSYEDKYLRGGEGMKSAERLIPAPIDESLAQKIKAISRRAFQAVDGRGIARVDFLVRPDRDEVYLNEINTMPGSLAFYLWREDGYAPADVVERLVKLAQEVYAAKRGSIYDYETRLVSLASRRGVKGSKS